MDHLIPGVDIDPSARIHVTERLEIGEGSKIHAGCVIEGREVVIGNGFWMEAGAVIGGGSCFENPSRLQAGHYLHMGRNSFINTARAVSIGNEVGLGTGTSIFTHGAYLSALEGFPVSFEPVSIGDRVWLPGATVNPGVSIGSDVVVGVGSVVTKDIPPGSLAMGLPAKVLKERVFPRKLSDEERMAFWSNWFKDWFALGIAGDVRYFSHGISANRETYFKVAEKEILGPVTVLSEKVRDQLRRYGIRFYASPDGGEYRNWDG